MRKKNLTLNLKLKLINTFTAVFFQPSLKKLQMYILICFFDLTAGCLLIKLNVSYVIE